MDWDEFTRVRDDVRRDAAKADDEGRAIHALTSAVVLLACCMWEVGEAIRLAADRTRAG